jgi:malate dehydrogenase (oxaloacetate-decarboxylating)(NADP+)
MARIPITKQEALDYHSQGREGKIEVAPTKPCLTARDLSMAYTPGVAEPCRVIHENVDEVYKFTAKGNLVAVVSNGTAVLGLGDIGAEAGKPVMEGKGVLFKRFADVDVFDLEVRSKDSDEIVKLVRMLEPTFGGINLEDIKAPECFYIEETLIRESNIPIFHDDQHGTAIISGAALINALEIVGKRIGEVIVVFNGAGAAGIACANLYLELGVRRENIYMCDSAGVIYKGRTKGMNPYKERYAQDTDMRTLAEVMKGADVFCGVSVKDAVTAEMVESMARDPIIFAMANPDPEITPEKALAVRDDLIMATGRSDYPNQVNNVLGFPFIFRGALDVRASKINTEMKMAASHALAALAKEDVPDEVCKAYGGIELTFGREYIIPKPFDYRVLTWVAPAVAQAAMNSGVARKPIHDMEAYKEQLVERLGRSNLLLRSLHSRARGSGKKVLFIEGEEPKIIQAAHRAYRENICQPILIGRKDVVEALAAEHHINLGEDGIEVWNPMTSPSHDDYAEDLYKLLQRKGLTLSDAGKFIQDPRYYALMMLKMGRVDGVIGGLTMHYPDMIRPALQIIKPQKDCVTVTGMSLVMTKKKVLVFSDTAINIDPTAEQLAEITYETWRACKAFGIEPKVALVSFSNFGSVPHPEVTKVKQALAIIRSKYPYIVADGEMQADTAVTPEIAESYPFSAIKGDANVLIFPQLSSGNIAYKLMQRVAGATVVGPILSGMDRAVQVLQNEADVDEIVHMTAATVLDAISTEERLRSQA